MTDGKDWTGNTRSVHATLGARNYAKEEREQHDYYATEPKAVEMLLEVEQFSREIWEPACGQGHISEVLKKHGHDVYSSDLIDRGYGDGGFDFLTADETVQWNCDIITNPPYKYGIEFVQKALRLITDGHKAAFFLKVQFLEGKARRKLYDTTPPRKIYVSSSRLLCAKNGDFEKYADSNAVAYAWYIWEKGYKGDTVIKWFN